MPKLVVTCTTGDLAGRRFEFDKDRVTVGRRDVNDLVLGSGDTTASSDHCELRYQAGRWMLADMASTNGTWVSGKELVKAIPVTTGLLFELGEGGPILMIQLPDDGPVVGVRRSSARQASFSQEETVDEGSPTSSASDALGKAPTEVERRPGPSDGHGPSTGRTAFYMALMTDKVHKSSRKLKVMIGLLALLLAGVVAFAVVMALRVSDSETKQLELATKLKSASDRLDDTTEKLDDTTEKLGDTTEKLDETQRSLKKATRRMKKARKRLATTAGKLSELRLDIDKARGEAKTKLLAQAAELEKNRRSYEKKLKAQEVALAKLSKSTQGGERIAKDNERALYMLIAPTPTGEFGFCTAFAVRKSGILATNNHCLAMLNKLNKEGKVGLARMNHNPAATYKITRWRGHAKHGKLLSEDVALLWIDTKGTQLPTTTTLASNAKVQGHLAAGKAIYTLGFPGQVMNEARPAADFRAAVISRLTDFDNGPGGPATARVVWHSALTSKGTSGSPIFDADGEVIAVNTGGLSARMVETVNTQTGKKSKKTVYDANGLNFGIRIDTLRELFGDDVPPPAPKVAPPATAAPTTAP